MVTHLAGKPQNPDRPRVADKRLYATLMSAFGLSGHSNRTYKVSANDPKRTLKDGRRHRRIGDGDYFWRAIMESSGF